MTIRGLNGGGHGGGHHGGGHHGGGYHGGNRYGWDYPYGWDTYAGGTQTIIILPDGTVTYPDATAPRGVLEGLGDTPPNEEHPVMNAICIFAAIWLVLRLADRK